MFALALLVSLGELPSVESKEFTTTVQQAAVQATVRIEDSARKTEGSGVILRKRGPWIYVLTANHVVEGATKLQISTYSQKSYPQPEAIYPAITVLARSEVADLALLRFTTNDTPPGVVPICSSKKAIKDKVFSVLTVGCTGGKPPTPQLDQVVDRKFVKRTAEAAPTLVWEMNDRPQHGRSGGPMLDTSGHLLGICSGRSDGKGYFCHVEAIHAFLESQGHGWLAEERP